MAHEIARTAPFRFPAITFDGTNRTDVEAWISSQGGELGQYVSDGEGNLMVQAIDPDTGDEAWVVVEVGDTLTIIFDRKLWTVIREASFSESWDVVA